MRVFCVVNGLPAWLFFVLWLPMQLGNLVAVPASWLVIAIWAHELDVAAGVIAATFLKLVTERVVRREMAAYLQVRQRPGTSEPGAVLRGKDVPSEGPTSRPATSSSLPPPLASSRRSCPRRCVGRVLPDAARDDRARLRRRTQPARRRCGTRRRTRARWCVDGALRVNLEVLGRRWVVAPGRQRGSSEKMRVPAA